jgi:indolepyruvate ferredoxin oxidoreductase
VLNTYQAMPSSFLKQPDLQFPAEEIIATVRKTLGGREPFTVEANRLATALCGDAIATNLFMLGYAWQLGLVPVALESLMRAVELNGAAVEMNKQAFGWGRLAAIDIDRVVDAADARAPIRDTTAATLDDETLSLSLDETIARRVAFLTDYQNSAYAKRYSALVADVRTAEAAKTPGKDALTAAVARYAFKLMAYKDEYEVARLYTSGEFEAKLRAQFEDGGSLRFHLAPPLISKKDADGHLIKSEYGPWIFSAFKVLKHLKFLRGTALDPMGHTDERKMERQLRDDYVSTIRDLLPKLDADNHALAVEIAEVPEQIRGFGHVKERHVEKAAKLRCELMRHWAKPGIAALVTTN